MFTRILVPLDGSPVAEQTLRYVRWLGRRLDAPIELLQVVESIPSELADVADKASLEKVQGDLRKQSEDYLENVAGPIREDGLQVSCTVLTGKPANSVISHAGKVPGTLVAISTHGRTGMDRWLLGSVTDKVVQASSSPLLIVRPLADGGMDDSSFKSILVPLDGSQVAEQVLPHVVGLAKPLRASVTLIRVIPDPGAFFGYLHDSAGVTEQMSRRVDAKAAGYLAKVGEKLRGQGVERVEERVLQGEPAKEILEAANETPNAAVAMVTHGTPGVGSWIIGAVTNRVVRYSSGPTLVVRAEEDIAHSWWA